MAAPGANLVVVAQRPASIEIEVQPRDFGGSIDAQFNLDLLASGVEVRDQGRSGDARSPWDARAAAASSSSGPIEIDFVAHISRRGDVLVGGGEWAAGPTQPAPIEGLEIRTRDVSIEAQFTNTRDARWSPWIRPGIFVGTRQQASPLTGLRLRLVGEGADRCTIQGEALFLGSPVMIQNDRAIELVSSAGVDPLVGLRLQIKQRSSADDVAVIAKPRVRVFRAGRPVTDNA